MNQIKPKKAPEAVRLLILECLKGERYRVHSDGKRYLDNKNIRQQYIIDDLIEDLERYHIFKLPQQGHQNQSKLKYQYIIAYNDPELVVHVKMTPNDHDPPMVFLGFHSHNTGFDPLPRILINPSTTES